MALGSLTLPTLGNSPTLPKAILRLVPRPVLLAVQARPSISRNSSPLPFVYRATLSLSLSRITVTKNFTGGDTRILVVEHERHLPRCHAYAYSTKRSSSRGRNMRRIFATLPAQGIGCINDLTRSPCKHGVKAMILGGVHYANTNGLLMYTQCAHLERTLNGA